MLARERRTGRFDWRRSLPPTGKKHKEMPVPSSRSVLLGDSGLVAYRLPVPAAADPDAGIAIRSAEIFSELMALHVGAGGDDGGVAIDANHHVGNIHSLISELAAPTRTNRFLLGSDLAHGSDRDIIIGLGALGEFSIATKGSLLGL